MTAEEVAVVTAIGLAVSRRDEGLGQVDLDKIPAWSKGASRTVGDKEKTVRGENDLGMKGRASGRNRGDRRRIRRTDVDGSGGGNRGNGDGKRKGVRWGRNGGILKLKHRRMVGRQSRRKPHVVVHLNVERGFERVNAWSMLGVIEIAEIGSVQGCAGKESGRKWREGLGGVFEEWRGRVSMTTN